MLDNKIDQIQIAMAVGGVVTILQSEQCHGGSKMNAPSVAVRSKRREIKVW